MLSRCDCTLGCTRDHVLFWYLFLDLTPWCSGLTPCSELRTNSWQVQVTIWGARIWSAPESAVCEANALFAVLLLRHVGHTFPGGTRNYKQLCPCNHTKYVGCQGLGLRGSCLRGECSTTVLLFGPTDSSLRDRSHPTILSAYSWLYDQGSLIVVLRRLYVVP